MDIRREKETGLKGLTPADFLIQTNLREGPWGGKIQHCRSKQICTFADVMELTLLIQEKLEGAGFPQAASEKRCWSRDDPQQRARDRPGKGREGMREKKPSRASSKGGPTFFVRINFQQNASWQGSLQWLEGKSTRFFRSHLEMIMLMQEAVDKSSGTEKRMTYNSWEDEEEIIS